MICIIQIIPVTAQGQYIPYIFIDENNAKAHY